MALPPSTISQVCRSVADFVADGLDAATNSIRVLLGNPADAVPGDTASDHNVNLFFYRLEPSGFAFHNSPGEPWLVRLHCLITAFGIIEDQISAGENDLRLIGEIVRLFHETPIMDAVDVNGETVRMQVVFHPLAAEDINHIWSTQGDVTYRTSIAYEMALAPVFPSEPDIESPIVGSIGSEVHGRMDARHEPFSGTVQFPVVPFVRVNTQTSDWQPHVCVVYQEQCLYSLAFELESDELDDFQPVILVAGEPGSEVTLTMERWDSTDGWQQTGLAIPITVNTDTIDPDNLNDDDNTILPAPPSDEAGQILIYVTHEYIDGLTGEPRTVRSNPLLLTLFEATP